MLYIGTMVTVCDYGRQWSSIIDVWYMPRWSSIFATFAKFNRRCVLIDRFRPFMIESDYVRPSMAQWHACARIHQFLFDGDIHKMNDHLQPQPQHITSQERHCEATDTHARPAVSTLRLTKRIGSHLQSVTRAASSTTPF